VDANRVAVLLNIAAVAVEKAEFRTAAQLCSRALALDPGSRKALLRRAKAHMGRHEPQVPKRPMLCRRCAYHC
jgi:Tfp pilus assembly protein PilF